ncbi:MAG: NAD(P)-dependent oxidoreductase [Chloroflexi bacterium]|nr:MAG: NAD(P)-dependent oxidoreductase [Chloroflexota bacterium]
MSGAVLITGATGRLGHALTAVFGSEAAASRRSDYDLDVPAAADALIRRQRPGTVIHCAAWTDVDACAREPELAMRRNGIAVGELGTACAAAEIDLVVVSTNEVFAGDRCDGAYAADDEPAPINAYGRSKLAGEHAARDAFAGARSRLFIVRTAWLFGDPGNDFPEKIVLAARGARANGRPLRLVDDEIGTPSYAADVARFIHALVKNPARGTVHHAVSLGRTSRADWALEILRLAAEWPTIERVPLSSWRRDSTPPRCAALSPSRLADGPTPRTWQAATAEYVPVVLRRIAATTPR